MKRLKTVRHIEDCLDSSVVKELEMVTPIDEPLMRVMALGASLDYHPEFPRPYYRITKRSCYVIQGVLGNHTCRVTFSPSRSSDTESELLNLIEGGDPGANSRDAAERPIEAGRGSE